MNTASAQKTKLVLAYFGGYALDAAWLGQSKAWVEAHTPYQAVVHEEAVAPLSPQARAAFFLKHAQDPDVLGFWALRGGEGCADVIPYLEAHAKTLAALPSKCVMGFSDVTAALLYMKQRFGWHAVHGPCAAQVVQKAVDARSVQAVKTFFSNACRVLGSEDAPSIDGLSALNQAARDAVWHEPLYLIGGNLCMLTFSVGDLWQLQASGCVLCVEDTHEPPYAVMRALKYMARTGLLDGIKALVLGDFALQGDEALTLNRYLRDFAATLAVPVYQTEAFGHGRKQPLWSMTQPYRWVSAHVDDAEPCYALRCCTRRASKGEHGVLPQSG